MRNNFVKILLMFLIYYSAYSDEVFKNSSKEKETNTIYITYFNMGLFNIANHNLEKISIMYNRNSNIFYNVYVEAGLNIIYLNSYKYEINVGLGYKLKFFENISIIPIISSFFNINDMESYINVGLNADYSFNLNESFLKYLLVGLNYRYFVRAKSYYYNENFYNTNLSPLLEFKLGIGF